MPDILTALRGAGSGADTRVFEVKHTVRISHSRKHTQGNVLLAAISSAIPNKTKELLNKQKTENKSLYLIFSVS